LPRAGDGAAGVPFAPQANFRFAVPDRPTRFKRPTLLIVGCGDVGLRVAGLLAGRWRIVALTSSPSRLPTLRAAGILPLVGDLDRPATLARLADLADAVLHLAPPAASGERDQRTARLVHALARSKRLRRLVYGSTSGVYGDCAGERIDETRPLRPASARARGVTRLLGARHLLQAALTSGPAPGAARLAIGAAVDLTHAASMAALAAADPKLRRATLADALIETTFGAAGLAASRRDGR